MTFRAWEVSKVQYCDHVGHEVALETEVVYPAEHLPDQPPRVIARRCSNAMACNQLEQPACAWCGTLPGHQPF